MSNSCCILHEKFNTLPRFSKSFDEEKIPENGIYIVFENGETAHGLERMVRVGTHTGNGNLRKRISEHLYTPKKDRSIFRKHIGRCILSKRNDLFLEWWNKDLTEKKQREKYQDIIDAERQVEIEKEVSDYITNNLSFSTLEIPAKLDRLKMEKRLLSTLAQCNECHPSKNWLGHYHPSKNFRSVGLWNMQGLKGTALSRSEAESL